MKERRYDIDWLRVIAMLAIFFYHCARFFGTEGWHLKNVEQNELIVIVRAGLIWMWVMEMFFVLSGAGAWFALKSRTGGQFLFERVKRLLVPLYTVGLFVLIPPQAFFEVVTNAGYTGSFTKFLPLYFKSLPAEIIGIAPRDLNDPNFLVPYTFSGHLWFLQYLFLISLVTLPLLLYLRSEKGRRCIDKIAGWTDKRGGIFIFLIPLIVIMTSFRFLFAGGRTWADFLWYAVFFVFGYFMVADKRFTDNIKKYAWLCLGLWIAGFLGIALIVLILNYNPFPGNEPFSLTYVVFQIFWSVTSWSAVVFVLSLGAKHLNFNNRTLAYANEAVLPFYLLHQTVILCVGWFIIPLALGILPKYLIIAAISFALIMGIYELLIRRWNVARFFFGMRLKKKAPIAPESRLEGRSA
ncbi:MAG: acyltransferase family protein [Anaerolineales bacterium]|jgi:peptidoglycan/LPS O-acetylase OafA/YrhL